MVNYSNKIKYGLFRRILSTPLNYPGDPDIYFQGII